MATSGHESSIGVNILASRKTARVLDSGRIRERGDRLVAGKPRVLAGADDVADLHLHQVTTPKLAIDRQIEQCAITQAAALVEVESNFPDLFRLQGTLCTYGLSGIPNRTLGGRDFLFQASP